MPVEARRLFRVDVLQFPILLSPWENDIRILSKLLGSRQFVKNADGVLELRGIDGQFLTNAKDAAANEKKKIGEFIVKTVLNDAEVVYLSTGTTVHACAQHRNQTAGHAANGSS